MTSCGRRERVSWTWFSIRFHRAGGEEEECVADQSEVAAEELGFIRTVRALASSPGGLSGRRSRCARRRCSQSPGRPRRSSRTTYPGCAPASRPPAAPVTPHGPPGRRPRGERSPALLARSPPLSAPLPRAGLRREPAYRRVRGDTAAHGLRPAHLPRSRTRPVSLLACFRRLRRRWLSTAAGVCACRARRHTIQCSATATGRGGAAARPARGRSRWSSSTCPASIRMRRSAWPP